jgi:hypothetical protein
VDAEVVSRAIVVYTGRGLNPFPVRSPERLSAYFGESLALDLVPVVERLDKEFYEIVPASSEPLDEVADRAAGAFGERHPELSREAVDAFRWCYTYDWK